MNYFAYEHAARTWAYQQRQWYGRATEVKELAEPTMEGARWMAFSPDKCVKSLDSDPKKLDN
jgi:hypothetical protein